MGVKQIGIMGFTIFLSILASVHLPQTMANSESPATNDTKSPGITETEPAKRIHFLRKEIKRHDYLYYTLGQPEISDQEYDKLVDELKKLEADYPSLAAPDSPTAKPGVHLLSGKDSVNHATPMLSINKIHTENDIDAFNQDICQATQSDAVKYIVEPKIDGVAIALKYENGQLVWTATRGDGKRGSNITTTTQYISSIPKMLKGNSWPEILEIRGELYWPRKAFEDFNRQRITAGQPPLLSPRNATAGTLQQTDADMDRLGKLQFTAHGIGYASDPIGTSSTESMATIEQWGIPAIKPCCNPCNNIDDVKAAVIQWRENSHKADFDTDGVVIKIDSIALRRKLGATNRAPLWCVAYKYAPDQAKTVLRNILFTVGRFGTITPVAQFDPVELSGAIISQASMNNIQQLSSVNPYYGDTIMIERAGEVIPQVSKVLTEFRTADAEPIELPTNCPACNSGLIDSGADRFCPNPACPAQLVRRIEHFAGQDQMNIEHIGPALINKLVDAKLVRRCSDLYKLQADQLTKLENIGQVRAKNIIQAIEQSKNRNFTRVLAGLGIRHVGSVTAETLADTYENIDELMIATENDLLAIRGVGPATAKSIHAFFGSPAGKEIIAELKTAGIKLSNPTSDHSKTAPNLAIEGKTFVITGKLKSYTRKQAILAIEAAGGKVRQKVSKNTDFVIIGDMPGSNATRTKELQIQSLTETKFMELLKSKTAPKAE